MSPTFVYITAGDAEEAGRIGRALVEERLAASVNILEGMRSLYWWGGKIEQTKEVVVVAKTRGSLVERLTERVKALHSYDCPCVVALTISGGNPAYLDWILEETGGRASSAAEVPEGTGG